jgi:hypothetical protein
MSIEAISKACQSGDLELLESTVKQNPSCINEVDCKLGWAPLYRTIVYGLHETAEKLLSLGADPNIRNRLGQAPLHQASENNQLDLARLLLRHKANPNLQQNDGDTPLHLACMKGCLEMTQILLRAGANPNSPNFLQGRTCLHYAVEVGQIDVIKTLLEFKACPYFKDKSGLVPADLTTDCKISGIIGNGFKTVQEEDSNSKDSVYEPESEKAIQSSNRFKNQPSFSFGEAHKSQLFEWLQVMRLEMVYENLQGNGFDDLDSLVESMKGNTPLTPALLIKIGIDKVGYRLRLLAKLEEQGSLTARYSQCNDSKLWCGSHQPNRNNGQVSLILWLKSLNLEHLYLNFVENGFDEYEQLVYVMNSSFPVDDQALLDIGICKIGHRHRILSRLNNDKNPGFFKNALRFDKAEKVPACESCYIM